MPNLPLETLTASADSHGETAVSAPIPAPLRIVIVDADRRVRQSLAGLMDLAQGLLVVGTASDAPSAVSQVELLAPDVVVVDPGLPDMETGFGVVRALKALVPSLRVIAMSSAETVAKPSINAGAVAFVPKMGQPAEFLDAILLAAEAVPAP